MQNQPILHRMFGAMRQSVGHCFERMRGSLPPWNTLLLLMQQATGSRSVGYLGLIEHMLVSCGEELKWKKGNEPSPSSYCRAREKLTSHYLDRAFAAALDVVEPELRDYIPRINGSRTLAMDGTWINVPHSCELKKIYGCPRGGPHDQVAHQPQMLAVVLTDAFTRQPIAHIVLPHDASERGAAELLMPHIRPGDLVLFDRGYHSHHLFAAIERIGAYFIARMCGGEKAWKEIRAAQRTRHPDATIMIEADGLKPMRHLTFVPGQGRPRKGTRKEIMHLLTNLPRLKFRRGRIRELYRARWGIETLNRELKIVLEAEKFHSRTSAGIKQELSVLFMVLAIGALADLVAKAEAGIEIEDPLDPKQKQCNRVAILEIIAAVISRACTKAVCRRAQDALRSVGRQAYRRRLGRKSERKCKGPFGRWRFRYGKTRKN